MGKFLKKVYMMISMMLVILLVVSGCNPEVELTPIQNDTFFGMTKAQWYDDYEYMWKTMRENYAFFGVAERDGVDIDGIYEKYKDIIKKGNNEKECYECLFNAIQDIGSYGHLRFFEPRDYQYMRNVYDDNPSRVAWAAALNDPHTAEGYEKLEKLYEASGFYGDEDILQESVNKKKENVTTRSLIKDQVAYMKINSFNGNYIETDQKVIYDFYDEIADYEHLIIDLSENGGGSDYYWMMLLVAPQLKEAMISSCYELIPKGENNKRYYESAFSENELKEIKDLPVLPKLNKQDLKGMKYFVEVMNTITPSEAAPIFRGKIWVLTSDKVYSASESFVQFCKATGFAKIVGTTTGGDGGGTDPGYMTLPNSGLLIRYSITYSLNQEGANSEEYGTEPDICSVEGEEPLDTCLKAINKQ